VICYRGLVVDIIRRLWDRGLYRDNKWLKLCHEYWFDYWVNYRAAQTMADVDRQIEQMSEDPEIESPVYWEQEQGETPLGGPIGFSYEFNKDNNT